MFDHIGQVVADALKNLDFADTVAGFCEPVTRDDNGVQRTFPAARKTGNEYSALEYLNMSPHDGISCLIFTDSEDALNVVSLPTERRRMEVRFRVVVWYDERLVKTDTGGDVAPAIIKAVSGLLYDADFSANYWLSPKLNLYQIELTPDRIWSRYRMGADDRALFVLPYRTIAITYRLSGYWAENCDCGRVIKSAKC
jgi:hypothetical protein